MTSDAPPPLVSFLTTAYRTEDYLADTIDSVLAQDSADWELVVVDNGHDDVIAEIVGRYLDDARVRLVRQENRGYLGGITAAAATARGTFVCPLDSDDQVVPHYVSTVAAFLEHHPDAGAVAPDAHLFTDERPHPHGRGYLRSVGIHVPARTGLLLTRELVLDGYVPYYGAAIRRTDWDAVGGYTPTTDGVDESVDIWLRLVERCQIYMLRERLGRYRVRLDSLSRSPETVRAFEQALVDSFLVRLEDARPEEREAAARTVRRLRYFHALRRARMAFSQGDLAAARSHAREAFGHRRTLRAISILALLRVAPGLLVLLHPLKQRLGGWLFARAPSLGGHSASLGSRSRRGVRPASRGREPLDTPPADAPPGRPPTSP